MALLCYCRLWSVVLFGCLLPAGLLADPPAALSPLGVNIGGPAYWSRGLFANTMRTAHDWIEYRGNEWGTTLLSWNNPQFDANGYPRYLQPGQKLRCLMWPFSANGGNRPATWPRRDREGQGRIALVWRGDADLRLTGLTFLAAESSGAATGRLRHGRRVYQNPGGSLPSLTVEDLNSADPVTDIQVWLPDPADPANRTLEGRFWHPNLLARLRDLPFGQLRTMDLAETNQSPQQDWADRRLPAHRSCHGILNTRSPAPGRAGNRPTGLAWEHLVDLANTLDRDLWICLPHLATDDYVTRLAQLIRFGSDGVQPYLGPTAQPVHRPLAPHLRVWVEYSNEIWSSGDSFPQGDWAQAEGAKAGLTKAEFNARRFAQIWRLFQIAFGGSERVVRVGAIFTANASYTDPFLRELARHGPTLVPAVTPDVIAPTTYFGNGIQDWAYERALRARGTPEQGFLIAQDFTAGTVSRPVSVPASDPYWTSPRLAADLGAAFTEWKRRLFSGSSAQGAGPDATGTAGGFGDDLVTRVRANFGRDIPLVSYEGGPSLYTDNLDGGDVRDDGLTTFMEALNRRPEMRDLLTLHQQLAVAKGLRSNTIFTDVGQWGKYGQWGHLEYPDQRPEDSPKWLALRDHDVDVRTLRPVTEPSGSRPQFTSERRLPAGIVGQPYAADIQVRDGDYPAGATPRFRLISSLLDPGLAAIPAPGQADRFLIQGRPTGSGTNYLLLRVADADGDAAWRVFSFQVGGGPGVLLQSHFEGADPARNLPWRSAFAVHDDVTFSGWSFGRGLVPQAGADALVFSLSAPADKTQSTLDLALAEMEHLACTLTPAAGRSLDLRGAVLQFSVRRDSFHAPRRWAVLASVAGFSSASALYISTESTLEGQVTEHQVTFPSTPNYGALTGPVEIRVVPFGGQYAGHPAALVAFRLAQAGAPSGFTPAVPASRGQTRLVNLSARGWAGLGAEALIAGFTLQGPRDRRLLIRGVGPALAAFGLTGAISEARLDLFRGAVPLQTNDGWDRGDAGAGITAAAAQVQAFALPPGSRDAALLVTLSPGPYTVQVTPARGAVTPGLALVEIYDADTGEGTPLVNLSTRARVGPGPETLIAGYVLAGDGAARLLLRGVGPGLSAFGLADTLINPSLQLYQGETCLDSNDDWPQHPARFQLAALTEQTGAFALADPGRDAALLTLAAPNRYTAQVTSADDRRGLALVEIYATP